jgi:protein AbiQ
MRLIYLSPEFYNKYGNCKEILKKQDRPYVYLEVEIEGTSFAIPFRHHISHKHAFITYDDCGLDYTKAVVISTPDYIGAGTPNVNRDEYKLIRRSEQQIYTGFARYIRIYKRAVKAPENPNNARIIQYSALQYFDELK